MKHPSPRRSHSGLAATHLWGSKLAAAWPRRPALFEAGIVLAHHSSNPRPRRAGYVYPRPYFRRVLAVSIDAMSQKGGLLPLASTQWTAAMRRYWSLADGLANALKQYGTKKQPILP